MIAIDVDGTLLGAEGKVSARNKAALQAASEAGIHVVIATGRRHSYAMKVLRSLDLHGEQALVSSNGAVTRTVGARLIDRTFLPLETSLWLCKQLDEFRNALVVTFDMVQPDGEDARGALVVEEMEDLHGSIGKWMEANAAYIEQAVPIESVLQREDGKGNAPIQMMVCGRIERMRRAEARLLEDSTVYMAEASSPELRADAKVTLSRTEYPDRDLSLLDILPAGCSKGVALLRLAASLGIEADEMMAIGDNWNDLSMLEIAGWPVLMGNAPADLQAMAAERGWLTTCGHDADGVAEAVYRALPELVPLLAGDQRRHGC